MNLIINDFESEDFQEMNKTNWSIFLQHVMFMWFKRIDEKEDIIKDMVIIN
jgi:hypothetical protein